MVNVISLEKARALHSKAFSLNIRCMQEKVAAMKAADSYKEDTNANSLTSQDKTKTGERN